MSQAIYSNAFNFTSSMSGAVDPRTGQYSVSIPFVALRPPNLDGQSRSIGITFSALRPSNRGFGVGWSMSLCSLDLTLSSNIQLTLSDGRSFWSKNLPSDGYDVTFEDKKLNDFRVVKVSATTFDVIYKDGVVERLVKSSGEQIARLSLLRFPTGETFQYHHDHSVNGVRYLTKVVFVQTGETHLEITYQGFTARQISYPVDHKKTARILLEYQNDLLRSVTLPYDAGQSGINTDELPKFTISYGLVGGYQCVTGLRSPTGALETVQYRTQGHKLNGGGYIPHVWSHEVAPGRGQSATTRTYSFSQDQNFLGYRSGAPQFRPGEDNLYLVTGSYTYKSTETVLENGNSLSVIERDFNRFHLMTKEAKTQQGTRTTTDIAYNEVAGQTFAQQPANLHLPKLVTTRYENLAPYASREEQTQTETDEHGNTLSQLEPTGVKTTYTYYSKSGETGCPADPFGFVRHVKRATVTPGAAGSTTSNVTDYTYKATSTIEQAPAAYFVNKATETYNGVMVKTFTFNDTPAAATTHGLLNKVETRLNNKTTVIAFSHVISDGTTKTTTTTTGVDGVSTSLTTIHSRVTGRRYDETDVNGVTVRTTYDVLGRVLEHVTSPGTASEARRRYEYSLPRASETNVWPTLTETDPQGAGKKIHFDGLGRQAAEEAQDDARDSSSPGAYRSVSERFYDVLGRVTSEKRYDFFWNADQTARTQTVTETKYEHDGWDRLRRTVHADGRAELSIHDLVARTLKTGIEGEGSALTQLDAFDNPLTITQVRADGTTYSTSRNTYDGFGRQTSEQDSLGNTMRYTYDHFDRVIERVLPENTRVLVHYADFSTNELTVGLTVDGTSFGTRTYDGLGRVTMEGVGGRNATYAYQGGGDKPHRVTTPKKSVLDMQYAPSLAGRLVAVSGPDVSSQYQLSDRTTAVTRAQSGDFVQSLTYFASGLSRGSSEDAVPRLGRSSVTTSYAHSMSGQLQTFTDGFGNAHTNKYDAIGRLISCQQGSRQASIEYDTKSRPKTIVVTDTAQGSSVTTSLTYDDFGREILRVVSGSVSRRIETSYFANGLVSNRITSAGVVLRNESYVYDQRSRLQQYECSGTEPPRDASGRAVQKQVFTFDKWSNITRRDTTYSHGVETTTYQFSAQDPTQLTAVVQNGNTISLTYDAAGNLTRDEQGRALEYDSQNRLLRVRSAGGQVLSEYHYDAMGKLVAQTLPGGGHAHRHYQGDLVTNQTVDDRKITYLSAEGQYFAQEERQGTTTRGQLFVTNREHSVVASAESGGTEDIRYTPYGERSTSGDGKLVVAFNGESVDPVTGWYFLGNGYRVYNPSLMRFHSPDGWSPFGLGGVNPYIYSAGDPINLSDPTGHFNWKKWLNIGIAVAGIVVGVVTLGAGLAVGAAAVAVALGVASSAASLASSLVENETASRILNYISLGLGVASVGAGIGAVARSATSLLSPGMKAANVVKNQVAGVTKSLVSKSLAISKGRAFALGAEGVGVGLDAVSKGTAVAAEFVQNEKVANILGWVSLATGAGATGVGGGFAVKGTLLRSRGSWSPWGRSAPTGARASDSDVTHMSTRAHREDAPFRAGSDRFNNAYNLLPLSPAGIFRNAELDLESLFVTRL